MPSVQELLAVLEADKSPFISLMEGVAGGYANAQKNRIENAKRLMEIDKMRQEQELAKEEQKRRIAEDLRIRTERDTQNKLKAQGGVPAVTPQQKQKKVQETDPKTGLWSEKITYETEDTKPSDFYTPDQARVLLPGDQTESLIKTFPTGQIPKDAVHQLLGMNKPQSVQFVGIQDGVPVFFNPKTKTMETGKLPGQGPLVSTTQTEGQANANLYAQRMEEADKQLNDLTASTDLTSVSAGLQGKAPNIMKSKNVQLFEQSKRNFLNAVLRRESGAVISPTEFEEGNKQYFPTMGDSPDVLAQKAANRKTAIEGLRNAAGEAPPPPASGKVKKIGRFEVTVN